MTKPKKRYMGQIMAECDCNHEACEVRGYCMAGKIDDLEKRNYAMMDALEEISNIEPDPDNMHRFHDIADTAITKVGKHDQ